MTDDLPMIEIKRADGSVEVIAFAITPPEPKWTSEDSDGDLLLITTSDEPGVGHGVYFRTTEAGSSVHVSKVPALIEKLQEILDLQNERETQHLANDPQPPR